MAPNADSAAVEKSIQLQMGGAPAKAPRIDTIKDVTAKAYGVTKAELESRFLKSSRKLLQREPGKLEAPQQQQLVELFQHSKALETMHTMRVELGVIWERSHFTREELVHKLQDWCQRAEASGIKALQDFSMRLPLGYEIYGLLRMLGRFNEARAQGR